MADHLPSTLHPYAFLAATATMCEQPASCKLLCSAVAWGFADAWKMPHPTYPTARVASSLLKQPVSHMYFLARL